MDAQPMRWWNGQSEATKRLGSGLAVCGTVVAAFYVIVQTGPSDHSMRYIDDGGRIAINSAAPAQRLAMNQLQSAVDASPARPQVLSMTVPIPQPSPLAAVVRTSAPVKRVASHSDVAKAKVEASRNVEQFDRCLPQCETRDPLIAGHPEYAEAAPPPAYDEPSPVMEAPVVEERVGFHPLAGARHLLNRAADAPGMMLRRSRQAIDNVARIDW
ncbi:MULTISPECIES: hypothetical protein [unclassified Rhizobium]|jgi:hypothetical protein|uniref:hypothetical protein n=1 Tax=unclassified Rhizobium TaxID=2613769 RepID=UPI0006459711|nr:MULTISPECIES: hypothetical protein [unclassified Rhizobium]MBN8952937.1 hypothetical protein [Rhizobium tropici]OJY76549.1 MAG: hypothetical protein BGP09_02625 [Rhizobium sp. 60-20]RKD52662.1 hypothetical protein BJ928_114116 [Rhizobium sp. WW_1]